MTDSSIINLESELIGSTNGKDASGILQSKGCGPFSPISVSADSLRLSIFERIRAEGIVPRATIARNLEISPATVTTQTAVLLDMGLVCEEPIELERGTTARGRPPVGLAVRPDAHYVAGLKLSDNEHSAVIYDFSGKQLASATLASSTQNTLDEIIEAVETLVQHACKKIDLHLQDLSAICVGVPGFIATEKGTVHWSPLIDGSDLKLAERLTDQLDLKVIIANDANLIALAELWFGVGRQISDFAVVTIEHGVGMGLVVNHKLYSGARGLGMEVGHTKVAIDGALCRCGQRGCLEAYVADYAMVREAALASNTISPHAPLQEVLESLYNDAKAGNATARSIFERAGRYLAMGLGNVANLFDPQLIILSGGRMKFDYLYSEDILEEMKRHALNSSVPLPPVEVHAWGDLVWAAGAAAMALSEVTHRKLTVPATTAL